MTKEEFYHLNVATARAFMAIGFHQGTFTVGTSDIFLDDDGNMYQCVEIAKSHISFNCTYVVSTNEYQIIKFRAAEVHNIKGDDLKEMVIASENLAKVDKGMYSNWDRLDGDIS